MGSNSVILEGARIEDGAIILPNSVVPPGRVVPANQVWGGNPIKFVRYAKDQEKFVTKKFIDENESVTAAYKYQFLPYNNAYLYKPSSEEVRSMIFRMKPSRRCTTSRKPKSSRQGTTIQPTPQSDVLGNIQCL